MDEKLIASAIAYIGNLFGDNSDGHGADHSVRVYENAMRIADEEPGCSREVVALAALLHDADDHKLFQTENNENARAFLGEMRIGREETDRILEAVNAVSFSRNRGKRPETPEGRIVQDADRLDALGAVGIARTYAYGGKHGRSLADSTRHFSEKLLLLRDEMNTESARKTAQARHDFLLLFLEELMREFGPEAGPDAP